MAKKNKTSNKIFKYISTFFSYAALVVLLAVAVFLILYIASSVIAKATNKRPFISLFTIVSPSMEPNIMVYDVIIDTRVNNEADLKEGDVITFYSSSIETGNYTVTHRINKILEMDGEKRYITKGDNNQTVDAGYITFKDIVGKQRYKIKGFGRIQVFIASKFGWLILILIPAIVIILFDLIKIIRIYAIKKRIDKIPEMKKVTRVREIEENKKIRSLTSKASRINSKKKR